MPASPCASDGSVRPAGSGLPVTSAVASAARCLQQGGLAVFPTETFYAVGCLAGCAGAVARVYQVKRRSVQRPLPLLAASREQLAPLVRLDAAPSGLLERFWPGPLTVLLPLLPGSAALSPALAASLSREGFAAVRVSSHPAAAALARSAGGVLTSSSANLSAQEAVRDAGDLDPRLLHALDGPCDVLFDAHPRPAGGLPSSIVRPGSSGVLHILREGAVSSDDLRAAGFSIAR